MGAYALATWALVLGLSTGWSGGTFGVFYFLGAIANIPLLATGSVYLVLGERAGKAFLTFTIALIGLGAFLTLGSPLLVPEDAVLPSGKDVLENVGPRIVAAIAGGVGTVTIVGLAGYSAARVWRTNRSLAYGNLLIVLGTLAPAFGGTLTALGEVGALAMSLLVGAVLLWAGYRVASGARLPARPPASVDVAHEAR